VDAVAVDGKRVPRPAPKLYFAVNKPKGYHCTTEAGAAAARGGARRRLVTDLLAGWVARWRERAPEGAPPPRLFTVGRLDANTTGLILVTNDGAWAQSVAHPSTGVTREYVATLARPPSRADLDALAAGAVVDGVHVTPVAVLAPPRGTGDPKEARRVRVVVGEGRHHEVRALVRAAGHDCETLKRVRVGGLRLPAGLGIGEVRQLKEYEAKRAADVGLQSNPDANPYAV
jgi:pseudouridine synthase